MSGVVTLSSKGQVTIPKAIRDRLSLGPGDRIVFRVRGEHVVVEPVGHLMDWYGAGGKGQSSLAWPEVRERVRREIGRQTTAEGSPAAGEDAGASP